MSYESYIKIMGYLDVIENELNKVAAKLGHKDTFETWLEKEKKKKN